jgi:hypothetical protein
LPSFSKLQTYIQSNKNEKVKKKHFTFIILNTRKPRKNEKKRNKQKTHNNRIKKKTDNIRIEKNLHMKQT